MKNKLLGFLIYNWGNGDNITSRFYDLKNIFETYEVSDNLKEVLIECREIEKLSPLIEDITGLLDPKITTDNIVEYMRNFKEYGNTDNLKEYFETYIEDKDDFLESIKNDDDEFSYFYEDMNFLIIYEENGAVKLSLVNHPEIMFAEQ